MPDGPDIEFAVEGAEEPLDVFESLVAQHHIIGEQAVCGQAGAGRTSSRMRALVSMPRSPTKHTRASPNRVLSLAIWAARVFGSAVLPSNTSMAIGIPAGEHVDDLQPAF